MILASIHATKPISSCDLPQLSWLPHEQAGLERGADVPGEGQGDQEDRITRRFTETFLQPLREADCEASARDEAAIRGIADTTAAWGEMNSLASEEREQLHRYRQAREVGR